MNGPERGALEVATPAATSDTFPPGRRAYLPTGATLPNWTVEGHLADGGLSSVYRVSYSGLRAREFPAEAALKITPLHPVDKERLVEEYETARRFSGHAQVVQVYDVFEIDTAENGPCIALVQEIGDESLRDRLDRDGPLDRPELWRLATDLAAGITALHDARIIHSDVKPGNILRFPSGWKLADLGAAATLTTALTNTRGSVADFYAGTLAYLTPETAEALHQNREPPPVHRDADVWAFGVVLHEAAVGRRPFDSTAALIKAVPHLDPALPADIRAVAAACLRPAGFRPRDGHALIALLADPPVPPDAPDEVPSGEALARTAATAPVAPKAHVLAAGGGVGGPPRARWRLYLAGATAALALVLAGVAVGVFALGDGAGGADLDSSRGASASAATTTAVSAPPTAAISTAAPPVITSTLSDGRLALAGTVRSADEAQALVSVLEPVVGTGKVDNRLVVDPAATPATGLSLAVVDEIVFAPGAATLEPAFLPTLDQIVALMNIDPSLTVVVRGHTDANGNPVANLALSQRRAEAVVDYIGSKGINEFRLEPQGRGSTEPIGDNATAEGRRQNRRIEFSVQGFRLDRLLNQS